MNRLKIIISYYKNSVNLRVTAYAAKPRVITHRAIFKNNSSGR